MAPIRVVVAEDSPTMRALLVGILERDPEIQVAGQAKDGAEAVELVRRLKPDLVTMDIHMPVMDGLAATREIMTHVPTPILVVSASRSGPEVELSLEAIRAGALMVVEKPDNPESAHFDRRQDELIKMAKAMAGVKVVRRWSQGRQPAAPPPTRPKGVGTPLRLVAIAVSTGGPAALQRILSSLPRDFPVPILVVQHIAAGFVAGLADWLTAGCKLTVKVAVHGEPVTPGTVLLAPDDRQLGVRPDGRVLVSEAPAINGFRPSGSFLFKSAAEAYGSSLGAVILTGMGNDGVEGLKAVRAAGGFVLAQDEATCVVYGMPGEAVTAGVVNEIVSLDDMATRLGELTANHGRGKRRGRSAIPPQRILIIDDDATYRKLATLLLEEDGHSVLPARNAEEGLRLAGDGRVDLILVDMNLPGMDGFQVLRMLRQAPQAQRIPAIALTAAAVSPGDEQQHARTAGFEFYITKPITGAEFQSMLDAWRHPA